MQLLTIQTGPHLIMTQSEFEADITAEHFTPLYWQTQNKISHVLPGRAAAVQFEHADRHYVLKHYHRGGLLAPLLGDRYLYTGLRRTRAQAEFKLLLTLRKLGLPVPEPVALHIERTGLHYRTSLITRLIANSQTLAKRLSQQVLQEREWQQIGRVMQRFHRAGVYHSDLNAHNILLDAQGKVWLIDFDKSYQRSVAASWQLQNLNRLQRSLNKLKNLSPEFHWHSNDWLAFQSGYQSQ